MPTLRVQAGFRLDNEPHRLATVGERYGRLVGVDESSDAESHWSVPSADEVVAGQLVRVLVGEDTVRGSYRRSSSEGSRISSACVWKPAIFQRFPFLSSRGRLGSIGESVLSVLCNAGVGNVFNAWETVLDLRQLLSILRIIFTYPLSAVRLVETRIPWLRRLPGEDALSIDSSLDSQTHKNVQHPPLRGRRLPPPSAMITGMAWHPEFRLLVECSALDSAVLIHQCTSGGRPTSSCLLHPDRPTCHSLLGEMTSHRGVTAAFSLKRTSLAQDFGHFLRKSVGTIFPKSLWKQEDDTNSFVSDVYEAISGIGVQPSRTCFRGVTCASFRPMVMDTVLAVGFRDGFEIWRKEEVEEFEDSGWICEFWHTGAAVENQVSSLPLPLSSRSHSPLSSVYDEGVLSLEWTPYGTSLLVVSPTTLTLWDGSLLLKPIQASRLLSSAGSPLVDSIPFLIPLQTRGLSTGGPFPRHIIAAKWAPQRPFLAVLFSDGILEIIERISWKSTSWRLPVDRHNPPVPILVWDIRHPLLYCATESRLLQFYFEDSDSLRSSPPLTSLQPAAVPISKTVSAFHFSSRVSRTAFSTFRSGDEAGTGDFFSERDDIPIKYRRGQASYHREGTVRAPALSASSGPAPAVNSDGIFPTVEPSNPVVIVKEVVFHSHDIPMKPIRSFAIEQSTGNRLVIIFQDVSEVFVFQLTFNHDEAAVFPRAIGVIPAGSLGAVVPISLAFTSHIPPSSVGSAVATSEQPSSILAVKWGAPLLRLAENKEEIATSSCCEGARLLLKAESLCASPSDSLVEKENHDPWLWGTRTVMYPFYFGQRSPEKLPGAYTEVQGKKEEGFFGLIGETVPSSLTPKCVPSGGRLS